MGLKMCHKNAMNSVFGKRISLLAGGLLPLLLLMFVTSPVTVRGQCSSEKVDLDIQLQEIVTQAQALSLSTMGVNRRGEGQQVASLILANNTDQPIGDLYFHIEVENTAVGVIATLDQRQGRPFELPPRLIRASNNDLQNGIPGIDESLDFEGGLTNEGEEFVNNLEGQTRLPDDVYTLKLQIYQNANRLNGGQCVASATAAVGEEPMTNVQDVYINSPGGEVDSGMDFEISTNQPQFDWSTDGGDSYRVVVVEASDSESPESLLEDARSTGPVLEDNQSIGNTLLPYEMADVRLTGRTSFQYPSSGVRQLEGGDKYYWQVTTLVRTPEGEEEINSEIWSFTIRDQGQATGTENTQMTEQARQNLRTVLGDGQLMNMQDQGMELQSVMIDGQRYSGQEMIRKLNEIVERARRGEITIVNDED